jgi:protein gp37
MSKIEWTDKTWNPVTGCTKISQGCKHCYAERLYERFHGKGSFRNITCHPDRLEHPLRWKKASMVFVNSMSDLFHEEVPFSFIYDVFIIMQKAHWHTFQVLTKRAQRMLEFFVYAQFKEPIPNVWVGVSVEDQKAADERIPVLLKIPAAKRFLSCEPLIGEVDLYRFIPPVQQPERLIDWVIVGGESGPGARPMHPDWARKLRDQCTSAIIYFFFKQWGEWLPWEEDVQPPFHNSNS